MEKYLLALKKWVDAGGVRRKWIAGLFLVSIVITGFLFIYSGSTPAASGTLEPTPLYFTGVMVKLVAVLLLIVGGAVMLRRWQVTAVAKSGRRLQVIETVRLSPKQAVHLVRIGQEQILIGATDQGISLLKELDTIADEALQPGLSPLETTDAAPTFQQMLHSYTAENPAYQPVGGVKQEQ